MKTITKLHLKALVELVEMLSIGGFLALVGDVTWVFADMYHIGFTRPELFFVAALLIIALVLTGTALYKYHMRTVKNMMKETLNVKLAYMKYKQHRLNKA